MEPLNKSGIHTRLALQLLALFLLTVHCEAEVYSDIMDYPQKCNFTKLMCNESRLLEEDKIIILNIANEMRNRVAGGSFSYLNLKHDPVSNMNKLSWSHELEKKSAALVSACPKTSSSFISQETEIVPGMDGIDYIEVKNTFDPSTYNPGNEIPGCEVSTITYKEKLTLCAPQKIKERLIGYLTEGGLSAEARKYDMRDFWMTTRFGEPRLTFRRTESTELGCSYLIRAGETHYYSYLTCIHCFYNSTLPIIGHSGEACSEQYQHFDEKYENLCSDLKNEYNSIKRDHNEAVCKAAKENATPTHSQCNGTENSEVLAPRCNKTEGASSQRPSSVSPVITKSTSGFSYKTTTDKVSTAADTHLKITSTVIKTQYPNISSTRYIGKPQLPSRTDQILINCSMEASSNRSAPLCKSSSSTATEKSSISTWLLKSSTLGTMNQLEESAMALGKKSKITTPQPKTTNNTSFEKSSKINTTTTPLVTFFTTRRKTATASTSNYSNLTPTSISSTTRRKSSTARKTTTRTVNATADIIKTEKSPLTHSTTCRKTTQKDRTKKLNKAATAPISTTMMPTILDITTKSRNNDTLMTYLHRKQSTSFDDIFKSTELGIKPSTKKQRPITVTRKMMTTFSSSSVIAHKTTFTKHKNISILSSNTKTASTCRKTTTPRNISITPTTNLKDLTIIKTGSPRNASFSTPLITSKMQPTNSTRKINTSSLSSSTMIRPVTTACRKTNITLAQTSFKTKNISSPSSTKTTRHSITSTCRKTISSQRTSFISSTNSPPYSASKISFSTHTITSSTTNSKSHMTVANITPKITGRTFKKIFQSTSTTKCRKTKPTIISQRKENLTTTALPTTTSTLAPTASTKPINLPYNTTIKTTKTLHSSKSTCKKTTVKSTTEKNMTSFTTTTNIAPITDKSTSFKIKNVTHHSFENLIGRAIPNITVTKSPMSSTKRSSIFDKTVISFNTSTSRNFIKNSYTPTNTKPTFKKIFQSTSTTKCRKTKPTIISQRKENLTNTALPTTTSTLAPTASTKPINVPCNTTIKTTTTLHSSESTCKKTTVKSTTEKNMTSFTTTTTIAPTTDKSTYFKMKNVTHHSVENLIGTAIPNITVTKSPMSSTKRSSIFDKTVFSFNTSTSRNFIKNSYTPTNTKPTFKKMFQSTSTTKCRKTKPTIISQRKENLTTTALPTTTSTLAPTASTKPINLPYNTTIKTTTTLHSSKSTCKKTTVKSTTEKNMTSFTTTTTIAPTTDKSTYFKMKNVTHHSVENLIGTAIPNITVTKSPMSSTKRSSIFDKTVFSFNTSTSRNFIKNSYTPTNTKPTFKKIFQSTSTTKCRKTKPTIISQRKENFTTTALPTITSYTLTTTASTKTINVPSNTTIKTTTSHSFKSTAISHKTTRRKTSTTSTTERILKATMNNTSEFTKNNKIPSISKVQENHKTTTRSSTRTATYFTIYSKPNTTSAKTLLSTTNTSYFFEPISKYSSAGHFTFPRTQSTTITVPTTKPVHKKHTIIPTSTHRAPVSTLITSSSTKPFKTISMITTKCTAFSSSSFESTSSSPPPTTTILAERTTSQNKTITSSKQPTTSSCRKSTSSKTSIKLYEPGKTVGDEEISLAPMTITAVQLSETSLTEPSAVPTANEQETTERDVSQTYFNILFTKSDYRQRQCVCVNWYMIGLIFIVAFLFAWCLICWQRVLLF